MLTQVHLSKNAQVTRVLEEEWSYIPVGGPLPLGSQTATAFGAAANLVHPATGYSIARSLREAPGLARDVAAVLRRKLPVRATAAAVWESLWPAEKRRQVWGTFSEKTSKLTFANLVGRHSERCREVVG